MINYNTDICTDPLSDRNTLLMYLSCIPYLVTLVLCMCVPHHLTCIPHFLIGLVCVDHVTKPAVLISPTCFFCWPHSNE